jgi:predicted protein tyrosine phosphatase
MKGRIQRGIRWSRRVVAPSILIALFVALASPVWAGGGNVTLIINAPDKAGVPRNYRSTSEKLDGDHPSTAGLDKLRASGSGQFSGKGLAAILKRTGGAPLLVLDLRGESHGFVGGTAVSWFASRDWANKDKTPDQISDDESQLLATLTTEPKISARKVTAKNSDGAIESSKRVTLTAQTVQSEEQLVAAQGDSYVRVYATDHVRFTDAQIDQLVAFWQNRPADRWVHVHCAAGDGRTTTALVMFDILENASAVSLKDIVDRQEKLGGIDVLSVKTKPKWRHDGETERAEFVRRFYQYAQEHPRGGGETWSSWAARNP